MANITTLNAFSLKNGIVRDRGFARAAGWDDGLHAGLRDERAHLVGVIALVGNHAATLYRVEQRRHGNDIVRLARGENGLEGPPDIQAMLGTARRTNSRLAVLSEIIALARKSGIYEGSHEELTPLQYDWLGIVPLAAAATATLFRPGLAETLQKSGWGAGLLTPEAIQKIAAGFEVSSG